MYRRKKQQTLDEAKAMSGPIPNGELTTGQLNRLFGNPRDPQLGEETMRENSERGARLRGETEGGK